jgi:NAD dependent epimerase/dehydratase family enzyme
MFFRVPSWAVRAILGEIAAEAMRDNAVAPGVLESSGFSFLHPSLEEALRSELGLI